VWTHLGYKLRTKISKGLKTRGAALGTAIKRYNNHAALAHPPLTPLDYKDVVSTEFLSELEFLRLRRTDIRERPWSIPAVRTGVVLHQKMERAREEIVRVAVEARRLQDWITQRGRHRQQTLAGLRLSTNPITGEVLRHCNYADAIDSVVLGHLDLLRRTRWFEEGAVFLEPLQVVQEEAIQEQQERVVDALHQEQVPGLDGEDDEDDEEGFGDEALRGLNIIEELERLAVVH
jgi:hypothetical protein